VRDQRLDTELVTIEVVTVVDVEMDVVVVEDVDEELVVDVVALSVIAVVTLVEVAAVVVGVDSVDVTEDVEDEITLVVGIDVVDSVEVTGIVEDDISVEVDIGVLDSVDVAGIVEDATTVDLGMEAVDRVDGVVETVRVELFIGWNLAALTPARLEITPATARKRITDNAIRSAIDFIQLSLLTQKPHGIFSSSCLRT